MVNFRRMADMGNDEHIVKTKWVKNYLKGDIE